MSRHEMVARFSSYGRWPKSRAPETTSRETTPFCDLPPPPGEESNCFAPPFPSSERPSRDHLNTWARSMVYSTRVPFEVRCRVYYWKRRRSWPARVPVTFNQKLLRKMVLDRRPLLTTFADKVAVRDYVAQTVGSQILPRLHAVVTDPAALDLSSLPTKFVVKPSHGSGMIWIVEDRDELDRNLLVATCRGWLATRYADVEQEWAYRHVPAAGS